jgi:hypothetical protein
MPGKRSLHRPILPGDHSLGNLNLPVIDLSAISKAFGGRLDGILGVDLLENLDVTIHMEQSRVGLRVAPQNPPEPSLIAEMEKAMNACPALFNDARIERQGPVSIQNSPSAQPLENFTAEDSP